MSFNIFNFRDDSLKTSELTVKLEPAFLAGLRCTQPQIRAKFFEIFDGSMRRRLFDRLMYITSSQNWESMGQHFWLKQCIELIVITAASSKSFSCDIILLSFSNLKRIL